MKFTVPVFGSSHYFGGASLTYVAPDRDLREHYRYVRHLHITPIESLLGALAAIHTILSCKCLSLVNCFARYAVDLLHNAVDTISSRLISQVILADER